MTKAPSLSSAQPEDAADAEWATWTPIWNTHKIDSDIQQIFQGIQLQELPPMTVEELDLVSGMYPKQRKSNRQTDSRSESNSKLTFNDKSNIKKKLFFTRNHN